MRQLFFFYLNNSLDSELFFCKHFMLTKLEGVASATGTTIR